MGTQKGLTAMAGWARPFGWSSLRTHRQGRPPIVGIGSIANAIAAEKGTPPWLNLAARGRANELLDMGKYCDESRRASITIMVMRRRILAHCGVLGRFRSEITNGRDARRGSQTTRRYSEANPVDFGTSQMSKGAYREGGLGVGSRLNYGRP